MPLPQMRLQDTAEVFYQDSLGQLRFVGCTDTAAIEKNFDIEEVRCGLGWEINSLIYHNPTMNIEITPAYWSEAMFRLVNGDKRESGLTTVYRSELVDLQEAQDYPEGVKYSYIQGLPKDGVISAVGMDGSILPAIFQVTDLDIDYNNDLNYNDGITYRKAVRVFDAQEHSQVYINYQSVVIGDYLSLKGNIPKPVSMVLHTIGYNPLSNRVQYDLFFHFDRVISEGAWNLSLTGGVNNKISHKFRVLGGGSSNQSKYTLVDRTKGGWG